ncbi:MAG: ROK family protein [Desulfocucumaceae bacterium]
MEKCVVGVDLGGTKIYTALADSRGRILAEVKAPTCAAEGPEAVIKRIVETVGRVRGFAPTAVPIALGIGSPGPLDRAAGVVYSSPNLPGWTDMPLRDSLEEATGIRVLLDNDANLGALGEYYYGAGQGARNMVYVTVSTGIGGGLILDGHIYRGAGGGAGEIGHTVLVPGGPLCACGRSGCLEALSSGTAIADRARELVAAGRGKAILREAGGSPGDITSISVARAAWANDPEAKEIIAAAGLYLGMGMASLINILNPERLVLGGGALEAGRLFWDSMISELSARALGPALRDVQVIKSGLGGKAGLMGAVALALEVCE